MSEIIHRGETMLISISADDFPISDLSDVVLTIKHGQTEQQLHLSDFTLVTDPDTQVQEYQYLIGQETTLAWSTKLPVKMVLETVTTSGTRVWQGEKRFEVGKTEYDEVMT
jgi:hypothetical protein